MSKDVETKPSLNQNTSMKKIETEASLLRNLSPDPTIKKINPYQSDSKDNRSIVMKSLSNKIDD